jgi:hypothetical protein
MRFPTNLTSMQKGHIFQMLRENLLQMKQSKLAHATQRRGREPKRFWNRPQAPI